MGMITDRKIGDSVELTINEHTIKIGILQTTPNSVLLDITAPQSIRINNQDKTHTDGSKRALEYKNKKKRIHELCRNSSLDTADKGFKIGLANMTTEELVTVSTETPDQEIAVAMELKNRGLL